jgi:hypothetical protein
LPKPAGGRTARRADDGNRGCRAEARPLIRLCFSQGVRFHASTKSLGYVVDLIRSHTIVVRGWVNRAEQILYPILKDYSYYIKRKIRQREI